MLSFGKPNEDVNKNVAPVNAFEIKSLNPSAEKKENNKSLNSPSMNFSGAVDSSGKASNQPRFLGAASFIIPFKIYVLVISPTLTSILKDVDVDILLA